MTGAQPAAFQFVFQERIDAEQRAATDCPREYFINGVVRCAFRVFPPDVNRIAADRVPGFVPLQRDGFSRRGRTDDEFQVFAARFRTLRHFAGMTADQLQMHGQFIRGYAMNDVFVDRQDDFGFVQLPFGPEPQQRGAQ